MNYKDHDDHDSETLDYDYITDGIYVGTNQCCAVGLNDVLKNEGITADVSLQNTKVDAPFGVDAYRWLPTIDSTPPAQGQLKIGVEALKEFVAQGRRTYVHCKNGHGRATTLVAAYLIDKGKSIEDAVDFIKSLRKEAHLSPEQISGLEKFAQDL